MAEPASWQLLEYLAERVRAISVANGYHSDLGASPVVLDETQLAQDAVGTVIQAEQITVSSASSEHVNYDMDITVEFGVPRDTPDIDAKQLVHRAAQDLSRALLLKGREMPRYVRSFEQTGAQLFSGEDDSGARFVVAQVTARAGLTELKTPATP